MKFSTLSKAGFAAALCAALAGLSTGVQAGTLQDTIFAKVEPSVRDRMFFRLSYINVNVKTTAKDAYDVTGPVLRPGDVERYVGDGSGGFVSSFYLVSLGQNLSEMPDPDTQSVYSQYVGRNLDLAMAGDATTTGCAALAQGMGTPCGIKSKSAARLATPALSAGYFIDDSMNWAVEAFLLATPIQATVYGDGRNRLSGKKIIETKMLPPLITFGRYFGPASAAFRPYLGVAASYAIFYGTKATAELNTYQGGASAGDTKVKVNNSVGFGPFIGLNFNPSYDGWTVGLSVGKIRFKTEATLVTQNTKITGDTPVLLDYGPRISSTIVAGTNTLNNDGGITVVQSGSPNGFQAGDVVKVTTALMCDLARAKYGNNDCNHGTFVRKASTVLDSTLFMFNVARSF